MPCRCLALTLLGLFLASGRAAAHRLEAEARPLPDGRVQVESWFDGGDSAAGARVQVYSPSGAVLAEGTLDERGLFAFTPGDGQPLRIVVSAGGGHRKTVYFPAKGPPQPAGTAGEPTADRSTRVAPADVLSGVAFLLALAAFVLSWRTAQQLKQLRDRGTP